MVSVNWNLHADMRTLLQQSLDVVDRMENEGLGLGGSVNSARSAVFCDHLMPFALAVRWSWSYLCMPLRKTNFMKPVVGIIGGGFMAGAMANALLGAAFASSAMRFKRCCVIASRRPVDVD